MYDDQSYDILKEIYDGQKWANDLDGVVGVGAPLHRSLRYAENHDEVRLASPKEWGGCGAEVGRPVAGLLFGLGRGPLLVYNGQEVGEPAAGAEGFGGDDGRTSLFDYWSMPELAKWVNGHRYDGGRLAPRQKRLRAWYFRLLALTDEPAFRKGEFIPLNRHNVDNPGFGRVPGEAASGHWLYAFLRHDPASRQSFLVVANLHGQQAFRDTTILLPPEALNALGLECGEATIELVDRLAEPGVAWVKASARHLREHGLRLPTLGPLMAYYFEVRSWGK